MVDVYRGEALRMAQLCFSVWNRDPASPSFGCFDRQFWGWKKKDFSDSALQAAISLCIRFAEEQGAVGSLPVWLDGYVAYLEKTQLRDGSFDQFYPNEHTPGVVHDMLSALLFVLNSPHLRADARRRLEAVTRRAVSYALRSEEKHGAIANHFAGYAWELIQYGQVTGDAAASKEGQALLRQTLSLLNKKEGWFQEYNGADAGYQTRLLAFLTSIAALTDDEDLWLACARAARFVEALLMPDNSLHPMLGVRSTALIYPSGFERLATRDPAFAPLADRIHVAWEHGGAPLPSLTDSENGIRLATDAFAASDLRKQRQTERPQPEGPKSFDFDSAGLFGRAVAGRQLYIAATLGGVVAFYETGSGAKLLNEDSGYLIRSQDGKTRWLTRRANGGRIVERGDSHMVIEAHFVRSLHEDISPPQMLLMRFLNLTVLRSQWFGDIFRKLVVKRLISGSHPLPLILRRSIRWNDSAVTIEDRLVASSPLPAGLTGARLFRCRRVTGNHMASARYFTNSELRGSPWFEEADMLDLLENPVVRRLGMPPL